MSLKTNKPVDNEEIVAKKQSMDTEPDEDMCMCGHCEIPEHELERNLLINFMDTSNINTVKYNRHNFEKGVTEMSEIAGKITALVNAGLSPSEAIEYIGATEANSMTYKLQTTLSKESNDTSIAVAKISGETAMKQQF